MDIEKIKELALANGFKLKEQASGNMDLNAYVYNFANAIEQAAKQNTWVDTSHLLPKELDQVFFILKGVVSQGYYFTEQVQDEYSGDYFTGKFWFCENRGDTIEEFHDVTHWAPIPTSELEQSNDS